jgi:hypothetical protein
MNLQAGERPANEKTARLMLNTLRKEPPVYRDADIPENVVIGALSDVYEPAVMPHRQILRFLLENMADSRLAAYFHAQKGSVCRSCHHNTPVTLKPPRCASCHGKPFDPRNPLRPGIKGAYHQQCMGCHQVLQLEKPKSTQCADCHKEKGK